MIIAIDGPAASGKGTLGAAAGRPLRPRPSRHRACSTARWRLRVLDAGADPADPAPGRPGGQGGPAGRPGPAGACGSERVSARRLAGRRASRRCARPCSSSSAISPGGRPAGPKGRCSTGATSAPSSARTPDVIKLFVTAGGRGARPAPAQGVAGSAASRLYIRRVLQDMKERDARDAGRGDRAASKQAADALDLDTIEPRRRSGVRGRARASSRRRTAPAGLSRRRRTALPAAMVSRGHATAGIGCPHARRRRMTGSEERHLSNRMASATASRNPAATRISPPCSTNRSKRSTGFEGTVVKGRVVAIENDFAIIDVGLKTEGPRRAQGIRGRPASPPSSRSATSSRSILERMENTQRRGHAVAREGAARGGLDPAREGVPGQRRASPASSSAASRAASPSISAAPSRSCPAARSTSARCATSAR